MGVKIQKNSKKKMKNQSTYIAFLCHIVSIQVDKQGLDIFKPYKSCIYPYAYIYNPILLSYEDVKDEEKWIWVSNMEISKTSQNMYISTPKP